MSMENPSQEDVDASLRTIEDLVAQVGDEIVDDIRGEDGDENTIRGRQVQHGQSTYQVLASPSWSHLVVQSQFNAVEALAVQRASSRSQHGQAQISDKDFANAYSDIQESVSEPEVKRHELVDRLTVPGFATELDCNGPLVKGFSVQTKLFPYDGTVSPKEFYEATQSVVSLMFSGRDYLTTEYNLSELATEDGDAGQRAFQ